MATDYRTTASIVFTAPVVIQQRGTGQFSNNVPADTNLVWENGMYKYPPLASCGAVRIPLSTATAPSAAVRLFALQGDLGASATWELHVAGNASNTSGTPYPSGSASNYLEGDVIVASGAATRYLSASYGLAAGGPAPILMPGQTIYLVTTSASSPVVRFFFKPLMGGSIH